MNIFRRMEAKKLELVAGVDEAGRGPLAGPVVAAAVILGNDIPAGLADSKRLSSSTRERVFHEIVEKAIAVAYRAVSPRCIDRTDVLRATLKAMREAIIALPVAPTAVRVDGQHVVPGVGVRQETLIGGDALCPAVSAASIVAKVIRDRMMRTWDRVYPAYGFADHKGYGTRFHVQALADHGPCPVHRFTFTPVRRAHRPAS